MSEKGNEPAGRITKHWHGLCEELTSDSDLFGITFPGGDVEEKMKATLLGALFLIDFKYYESCELCQACCC
jgi:hypothetical protein